MPVFQKDFVSRNIMNLEDGENVVGGGRPNITSDISSWKLTLLAAEDSLFGRSVALISQTVCTKRIPRQPFFHAAYRREVIAKVGGFNENLGRTEDNEFHYRIRKAGYKMCCCPDIVSYQHARNNLKYMVHQKYSNGRWIGTYPIGMSGLSFLFSFCSVSFRNGIAVLFYPRISRTSAVFICFACNLRNV